MARRKQPIEVIELEKSAAERHATDMRLYDRWTQGGKKPEDLEPIVKRYDRYVYGQMAKKAPFMDAAAHQAAIRNKIIEAVHTYDPSYGTQLSTHVIGRARAAQRWMLDHANSGRGPEKKVRAIGPVQVAHEHLYDEFGREPTHTEVAMHLKQTTGKSWTPKDIEEIRRLQGIKDVPMSVSGVGSVVQTPRHMEMAGGMLMRREIEVRAPAAHRDTYLRVYDHLYGVNGAAQVQDTGALARTLGVSEPTVSRAKTFLQNIGVFHL